MKIVINACYGGFGLSEEALTEYRNIKNIKDTIYEWVIPRNDPVLVSIVETMGQNANGNYANLKIVEIPDDVDWEIRGYDGDEWVSEKRRTWR